MHYMALDKSKQAEIENLFSSVFTVSEGEQEGRSIGRLASALSKSIDGQEIICFGAYDGESLIGAIFFTLLEYNIPAQIFLLSPVAVSTSYQGKGVGQELINFGLRELKNRNVDVVLTYGDPAFYTKVGFQNLSEGVLQAPFKLSMPWGWLGQSIRIDNIPISSTCPTCVEEFNNPALW